MWTWHVQVAKSTNQGRTEVNKQALNAECNFYCDVTGARADHELELN